jgi:sialate O-acetylesterase
MKKWSKCKTAVGLLCLLAFASFTAGAAVSVPNIIGDHMVLKADKPLPIWGKAAPGEKVSVTFNGKTESAIADSNGKWLVKLAKAKAGGPFEMTIAGKDNTLKFSDILVGEVWIGSGQSNMQFQVNQAINGEKEIADAKYPEIHLFSVKLTVAGEPQDNCEGSWTVCTPETVPSFSAVLYFFGRDLHKDLKVPVGLINSSWGGTPAESWTSRPTLENDPDLAKIVTYWDKTLADYPKAKADYDAAFAKWKEGADKAKAEGKPEPGGKPSEPRGPQHSWRASGLFNAMIAPLVPYAISGSIWYQGESNAGRAFQYRKLFAAMIEDWRKAWNQGPFPFYFVQLANFTDSKPDPDESEWAELREAQTMTLSLKNTGMAVIIDIGDAKDIHPKNKQDVGKRLELNALAKDYGQKVEYSGPMYKSMKVKGNAIELSFDHVSGGLSAKGDSLKGFAIAGEDKKFVWADAKIEGKKIIVSSDKVAAPVAVRYAWAHNPVCNLYNGEGLPASPFRTDAWDGITVKNFQP